MKDVQSFLPAGRSLRSCLLLITLCAGMSLPALARDPYEGPARLGSNENAFGPSPKAVAAMRDRLDNGNYYNRSDVDELVQVLAKKEGVKPDHILPTVGSGPVLLMAAAAYAEPGKNMVTTAPGYPQLTGEFAKFGGEIKYVPVGEDMGYDLAAIREAIDENTSLVYICNPNNPTGVLANAGALRNFIMSMPDDVLVFVDEAYLELSDSGFTGNTMAPLVGMKKNLIVSRTFSKAYGLAGYRVGYGIAQPVVLEKLKTYYQGGPSFLSAVAALAAVQDTEHLQASKDHYQSLRSRVYEELEALDMPYVKSDAAFVFFNSGMDAQEFAAKMAAEDIEVRPAFAPADGFETWARVSIGAESEIDAFVTALKKIKSPTVALAQ